MSKLHLNEQRACVSFVCYKILGVVLFSSVCFGGFFSTFFPIAGDVATDKTLVYDNPFQTE